MKSPPSKSFFEGNGKKTLALDLDELLSRYSYVSSNVRLGLVKFIEEMDKCYNVIIFSMVSDIDYAEKLIDVIDPNKICGKILAEKDDNIGPPKDLTDLNVDLKDVVMVDIMAAAYYFEPECETPIKNVQYDENCTALYDIIPVL